MTGTIDTEPGVCAVCLMTLTVSGLRVDPDPFLDEPQHVFCDICGEAEHPADLTTDWNGKTGCHLSCEQGRYLTAISLP
jgi:hypothetical protein